MVDRPDLDEFLGALSGFVSKKNNLPQDPSYFRFLEIFCRSVGSSEGHLLQYEEGKGLKSVISCGMPKDFDKQYNTVAAAGLGEELSPLDRAFRDQRVDAVTEIKRDAGMPIWFLDFAGRLHIKAMVAVPLIGQTRPVGVLCAYYRDVCLFDQGTLDRLMTIGRMVGTAIENSAAPSGAVTPASTGPADSALDAFLALLTTQALTQIHVFEALVKVAAKSLSPAGLICGPLRMSATDLTITVAEGAGIPPSTISHRFVVPPVLSQQLLLGRGNFRQSPVSWEMLGPFQPLVTGRAFSTICHPIVWRKQPQAAVVAWRSEKKPFTGEDELLLTRLSAISSLALRAL